MDPASIAGLASACLTIVTRVVAVVRTIDEIRNADRSVTKLQTNVRLYAASIEQLQRWLDGSQVISQTLYVAIRSSIADCATICDDVESHIRTVRSPQNRTSLLGRVRHVISGNGLAFQEQRLSHQMQTMMLLANLVKLNDAEQQDSKMQDEETRSTLTRSHNNASSVWFTSDNASSAKSSNFSAQDDIDANLQIDEELIRSGPYVSHYRKMVAAQRPTSTRNLLRLSLSLRSQSSLPEPRDSNIPNEVVSPSISNNGPVEQWDTARGRSLVSQLCQAASEGNIKWIDRLLEQGAFVNGWVSSPKDNTDDIVLSVETFLHPFEGLPPTQKTPLIFAVDAGLTDVIKHLLKKGADPNTVNDRGQLLLTKAIITRENNAGRFEAILQLLLDHGANPNQKFWPKDLACTDSTDQSQIGFTPLCLALANGHVGMVRRLVKAGADVNAKSFSLRKISDAVFPNGADWTKSGVTPLSLAIFKGDLVVTKQLVAAGADVNALTLHPDPMSYLSECGRFHAAIGKSGLTPLGLAIYKRHDAMVERLVEAGADVNALTLHPDSISYPANCRPLHVAVWIGGSTDVLELLLKKGARVNVSAHEQPGFLKQGNDVTPLHIARGSTAECLLSRGADIFAVDERENTPLHWVASDSWTDCNTVETLLRNGAPVNVVNRDGMTPFHILAQHRHRHPNWGLAAIRFLDAKGDPLLRDPEGRDVLSICGFDSVEELRNNETKEERERNEQKKRREDAQLKERQEDFDEWIRQGKQRASIGKDWGVYYFSDGTKKLIYVGDRKKR